MGSKIITKTDRQMEDRMLAVSHDPKRTWLELAEALAKVQHDSAWQRWGFADFDGYCRKELHLRSSTVAKLLGSYRFLETSAPRVLERAHATGEAPIPTMAAVEFVQRATERAAADPETLESIQTMAFDEGVEAPLLARRFKDVAFPENDRDRKERLRAQLAQAARRLSTLVAEEDAPISKRLAIQVEELVGELLAAIEN
jgi:hypothetical protein